MDRLFEDEELAPALGASTGDRLEELGISWDRVVTAFTS
jgi:hypothetical protein